jgi:hypothetical protein
MYLTGDVSATGDLAIHMHGERNDDSRSIPPEPFTMVGRRERQLSRWSGRDLELAKTLSERSSGPLAPAEMEVKRSFDGVGSRPYLPGSFRKAPRRCPLEFDRDYCYMSVMLRHRAWILRITGPILV